MLLYFYKLLLYSYYSQLVRTGEELEIITDLDIEALVGTQDIGIESSI